MSEFGIGHMKLMKNDLTQLSQMGTNRKCCINYELSAHVKGKDGQQFKHTYNSGRNTNGNVYCRQNIGKIQAEIGHIEKYPNYSTGQRPLHLTLVCK